MNTQNIDRHGNVLWLDEERLTRKVMDYEPYSPPEKGLGFVNFIKEHVSARPWNMKLFHKIFYLVVGGSRWLQEDSFRNRVYRWITMISPEKKRHTSAVVLPLNVDLTESGQKVPIPADFLKEALRHTTFIAGMPYCICREASGCPQEAITFGADGKIQINQEYCTGCGICKARCRRNAIKIKQTMPMRSNLHAYFETEFNIDVKVWNEEYTRS